MHRSRGRSPLVDPALAWSNNLSVTVGGAGTLAHAGVVLPRLLADRLGLTAGLSEVMARASVPAGPASGSGAGGRGVRAGGGSDVFE